MAGRKKNLDKATQAWRISDVSGELGLSLRAIRFYEARGLIKPKRRGNRRLFTENEIERLRLVMKLKSLGLSLFEIRRVLVSPGKGPYGLTEKLCDEMTERLHARKIEADAALAQLQEISRAFPGKVLDSTSASLNVITN